MKWEVQGKGTNKSVHLAAKEIRLTRMIVEKPEFAGRGGVFLY